MATPSRLAADRHPPVRGVFRTDWPARCRYADTAGIMRTVPDAVCVPADVDDLTALVRWARAEGVALIPRGSGSGMAGGAQGAGVVVDLSRFTMLHLTDPTSQTVVAGAGVLRGAIDAAARAHGLRFPVDPSSGAFCTIGGMVATNAAGARSLRFGATRPWVRGIECVFDDGSVAWVRRGAPPPADVPAVARLLHLLDVLRRQASPPSPARYRHVGVRKESSGYGVADALASGELVDLLVGSEGTLACFTAVEVALTPVAAATATRLAMFGTLDAAVACAVDAAAGGATACELLDRTFLEVAAHGGDTGVPAGAEAVLLIETEGDAAGEATARADAITALARRHGATAVHAADTPADERRLWALRHAASPILSRLAPRLCSMQFIEDGCVPPDRFAEYVRGVRGILDAAGTVGVIFGHAGDAHAHVNPLVDVTRSGWRDRVRRVLGETCALTARLGGTLAGEHGDGRLRAPLLEQMWSADARDAFVAVKAAGDPAGILNPGCKVARAGDDPLAVLRHDPEASALDPAAQAILAEIERTRDWSRFRLG
jgi:FAD/FMN-containing dehydrogenase